VAKNASMFRVGPKVRPGRVDNRPSPSRRGYGREYLKARARLLAMQPACERCGRPAEHAHHRVKVRRGGDHSLDNLEALCTRCHMSMHARKRNRR
jgi:5-methylcytosine-specific restriction protein A